MRVEKDRSTSERKSVPRGVRSAESNSFQSLSGGQMSRTFIPGQLSLFSLPNSPLMSEPHSVGRPDHSASRSNISQTSTSQRQWLNLWVPIPAEQIKQNVHRRGFHVGCQPNSFIDVTGPTLQYMPEWSRKWSLTHPPSVAVPLQRSRSGADRVT